MDAAQSSAAGQLIRRAIDLGAALKLGFRVSLDEVGADEFQAMAVLEDEREKLDRERVANRVQS